MEKNKILFCLLLVCVSLFESLHAQVDKIESLPQLNKDFQIVVHSVRGEDGEVIDTASFSNIVNSINPYFEAIGVSYSLCDSSIIDNFQFDTSTTEEREDLIIRYSVKKRINVFLFQEIEDLEAAGLATLEGVTSGNAIYLAATGLSIGVFAHEMGHFMGLPHTFEIDNGQELVDGSNCTTAGDKICDTPADPYDENNLNRTYLNDDCVFIDRELDPNGDYYSPLVNNIMSYYTGCSCGTDMAFTHGQYLKMVEVYQSNPILW